MLPVGSAQKRMLLDSVAIMLVIVALVILLILAFEWWLRASNRRATFSPD